MEFNVEARRQQLENLQQFVVASKNKIQLICDELGWKPEKVLEDNSLITCSLDTGHKISQKSADKHIKQCALRKEGYVLKEQFLSEPVNDSKSSILIDDYKKIEVLSEFRKVKEDYKSESWNGQDPDPKTADRLTSTFSSHERLALYNYAVTATAGPPKLPDYDIIHCQRDNSKPLSYEEQLAQERDARRRRVKYKTVHTSHKNHTELLREVIQGQMELYKDWVSDNNNETVSNPQSLSIDTEKERSADLERAHSMTSRNSTRSDSSRRPFNNDEYKSREVRSSDRERGSYYERSKHSENYDKRSYKYKDRSSRREASCRRERSPYRSKLNSSTNHHRSRDRSQRNRARYNNDKYYKT